MSLAQSLLPEFEHEMASCRKELERVPDGRFDFRPHPKSASLEELANHLATIPGWLDSTLKVTEMDFSAPETLAAMPRPVGTREELVAVFDRGVAEARAALAGATDEDFAVVWRGRTGEEVLFAMPRIAVYRSFVMNHLIHHRAQLGVYLRMLDVPLPSIYGPTADEPGA